MRRPQLLDLYSGAGGAAMGYARAGFDVTGVDIKPQPRYPFTFRQGDVLKMLSAGALELSLFDVIHASPPCQLWSAATPAERRERHLDALGPTREHLLSWGGVWVIENVPGAPLRQPLQLCGSELGLRTSEGYWLKRHRLFESSVALMGAGGCWCRGLRVLHVSGSGGAGASVQHAAGVKASNAQARELLGIDWMTTREMSQAIPPAYTEHIGGQLIAALAEGAGRG